MNDRQSAICLGWLSALFTAAVVLLAPELDSFREETASSSFVALSAGLLLAIPPLLAIWAVHSQAQTLKRLLVTTWLFLAFFLAAAYGQVRNYGCGDLALVLVGAVGWSISYVAVLTALSLLRAVRGWRLRSGLRGDEALHASEPSQRLRGKEKQFTIRTLLVWTAAAAMLCAGVRCLAPYGTFESGWMADQSMLAGLLFQATLMGCLATLAGLPVLGVAWLVLAEGRRPIWRSTLIALTVGGILGGAALFGHYFGNSPFDLGAFARTVEIGVLVTGLLAVSVMRFCGYRLIRPLRSPGQAVGTVLRRDAKHAQRRFAIALAAFAAVALVLAAYAPFRLEAWRRADALQLWIARGWNAEFDDEGRIVGLARNPHQDLAGSELPLSELTDLRWLDFSNTNLTDIQLLQYPIHCPAMARLEALDLAGTWVSDEILSHTGKFPKLKELRLAGTKITDVGFSQISVLTGLQQLDVSDTAIALERAPSLPELESLSLDGTEIRDAALANMANFPKLKTLALARINVTDAGLNKLAALTSLTSLDLSVTDVTDQAAASLSRLGHLRSLNLQFTAVSEAGFAALHKALPDTDIRVGASDAMLNIATHNQARIGRGRNVSFAVAPAPRNLKRLHARGNYPIRYRDGNSVIAGAKTVTDAGLNFLAGQTAMEELDLRDAGITDAGVPVLSTLTSLKRLDLRGTAVTERGRDALTKALPGCEILR